VIRIARVALTKSSSGSGNPRSAKTFPLLVQRGRSTPMVFVALWHAFPLRNHGAISAALYLGASSVVVK